MEIMYFIIGARAIILTSFGLNYNMKMFNWLN